MILPLDSREKKIKMGFNKLNNRDLLVVYYQVLRFFFELKINFTFY